MPIQTSISNKGGLVDRYINTSYDIVVFVANNMDAITSVYSSINSGQLTTVQSYIDGGQIDAAIAAAVTTSADAAAVAADRAAVEATYDLFDDRMLGAFSTDPTLDNDGNALVAGTMYFNTTLGRMQFYSGSGWVDFNTGVGLGLSDSATATQLYITDNIVSLFSSPDAGWDASHKVLQITAETDLWWTTGAGLYLSYNVYHDGVGYKRKALDTASMYFQGPTGTHQFLSAVSAAADSTITWISGLNITAAGEAYSLGRGNIVNNTAFGISTFSATTTGALNSAFGSSALAALTTGTQNTAMGYQALTAVSTADSNVAIGYAAGSALDTLAANSYNVVIGASALQNASDSNSSVVIGHSAANSVTTGLNNAVVIGRLAFENSTQVGSRNMAIGYQAGRNGGHASAFDNIYIGYQAGSQGVATSTSFRNIAIGSFALEDRTSGQNNIAIGTGAGRNISTGDDNVVIGGYQTGDGMTSTAGAVIIGAGAASGSTVSLGTVAIGYAALAAASGVQNTAIGYGAGISVLSAARNTFLGYQAGYECNASDNTYIGSDAGSGTFGDTGQANVAVGSRALFDIDGGDFNVAIGAAAGENITTGANNVVIGTNAAFNITNAGDNIVVGKDAGYSVTSMTQCTYVGKGSGYNNTNVSYNVVVGSGALLGGVSSTPSRCTAVGHNAMDAVTTGSYNVAIGSDAGGLLTTGQYNTYVGSSTGNLYAMTGTYNTMLGYGAESTGAAAVGEFTLGDGNVVNLRCNDTTISGLSDRRDKKNIRDLNYGLDFITRLQPKFFNKDPRTLYPDLVNDGSKMSDKLFMGLIAQDVEQVMTDLGVEFPTLHKFGPDEEPDRFYEMGYTDLIMPLINAVKELKAQVEALQP